MLSGNGYGRNYLAGRNYSQRKKTKWLIRSEPEYVLNDIRVGNARIDEDGHHIDVEGQKYGPYSPLERRARKSLFSSGEPLPVTIDGIVYNVENNGEKGLKLSSSRGERE